MKKDIIVTLRYNVLDKLGDIKARLIEKGMHIKDVYEFGVITGSVDIVEIEKLRKIEGIESVEDDQEMGLNFPSD